jgi:hypothetical protein
VLIVDVSEVKLEAKQNNLPPEYWRGWYYS